MNKWRFGIWLLALLMAGPVIVIYLMGFYSLPDLWAHWLQTVLPRYMLNTLLLAVGVGLGTAVIGTLLAWIMEHYEFPGRRLLTWLVLLPMAMPAYIIAYAYTGLLDAAGPIQTTLRSFSGWSYGSYWFPEVRSLLGAIILLVLVLYPYVYLLARNAFKNQPPSLYATCQLFGVGTIRYVQRIALPLARPAIAAGAALAMMEAVADFGTVQYFGVNTLTTGIFRAWFGQDHLAAAAQLSALLVTLALLLLIFEQRSRRQLRYVLHQTKQQIKPRHRPPLIRAIGLSLLCLLPIGLGFILPTGMLLHWAFITGFVDLQLLSLVAHSLQLATMVAVVTLGIALLLAYGKRLHSKGLKEKSWLEEGVRLATVGYAVPGLVIALGVMIPFSWLDQQINHWLQNWFGVSVGLLFSGSLFALVFALAVRFLSVSFHSIEVGLGVIKPSMDQAARVLGLTPAKVLRRVHWPLLKASGLSALLLVFVDVLKELPATLVLRPFNFDTLAIRTFELASDERLAEASWPALTIVCIGLIPVCYLFRLMDQR